MLGIPFTVENCQFNVISTCSIVSPTSLSLPIHSLACGAFFCGGGGRGGELALVLVVREGERRVGAEWELEGLALGGELETVCLLWWPWKEGGTLHGAWLREEGRD